MSEHGRLHGHGDGPEKAGGHDRGRHFAEVGRKRTRARQKVFREQAKPLILKEHIPENDHKFQDPGGECSDAGAPNPHLRKSELPEDQGIVDADVRDQGDDRDIEADIYDLDAPKRRHQDVGQDKEQEGVLNDIQVGAPLGDDRGVCRENAKDLLGEEQADAEKEEPAQKAQLQRHACEFSDRLCALLPPVLGGQNDQRVPDGDRRLLHEKEDLVDGRRAGERGLAVSSQHDIVGHVDTVSHQVLEGDHCHQTEKCPVKTAVMRKEGFARICLSIHSLCSPQLLCRHRSGSRQIETLL